MAPRGNRWLWLSGGLIAFVVATIGGVIAFGTFNVAPDPDTGVSVPGANSFALILALAAVLAFVVYAALEYWQTHRLASITSQFDTRTLVLMPIAIAFNIILGQAVGAALKIPIYLDSIGTILVGALCGPIPGALTGLLANMLWSYAVPPPFHSDISGAFAIVAAVIGLLAGLFGRYGFFRPRPTSNTTTLLAGGAVAVVIVGAMVWYAYTRFYGDQGLTIFNPDNTDTLFVILGWAIVALAIAAVVGFLFLLLRRRDLTVAYVVVGGVATGIVAALISAPISANVFGGVTGAGTDFLVAAFRQAGSDVQTATFQQGLLSDPVDKLVTFMTVYIILSAMAVRTKARFPQGERLVDAGAGA
jgi:energy-coupling factor transport system substrate-specific component